MKSKSRKVKTLELSEGMNTDRTRSPGSTEVDKYKSDLILLGLSIHDHRGKVSELLTLGKSKSLKRPQCSDHFVHDTYFG